MKNNIAHLIPQISLAEVDNCIDPTGEGLFNAKIAAEGNEIRPVFYTTPYASNEAGAFIAIPEDGVQVLVCKPAGSGSWYYLGATFSPPPNESTGSRTIDGMQLTPLQIASPKLSQAKGVPMRMQFTGTQGGGLEIIEEKNDNMMNKKVVVQSGSGKKVSLNDNPTADAIVLDSGNGASIRITDNPQNPLDSARAVIINSDGPQRFINGKSQTSIAVVDGRELNLINDSPGLMGSPVAPAGNVNIQSKWRDVNIFSQGPEGKIFIKNINQSAVDPIIEISTGGVGGAIDIKTNGKVRISALEGIDIDSLGPINMRGTSINMEATAGDVNIKGLGTVSLQSDATIQLNPPTPLPPVLPELGVNLDAYLGLGVQTY